MNRVVTRRNIVEIRAFVYEEKTEISLTKNAAAFQESNLYLIHIQAHEKDAKCNLCGLFHV